MNLSRKHSTSEDNHPSKDTVFMLSKDVSEQKA